MDEKYEEFQIIGEGSFAQVFKTLDKKSKKFVAIKIYKEEFSKDKSNQISKEISLLKQFNHPNIISLNKVFSFKK